MKVLRRTTQELAFASEDIACTTTAMASNIATTAVEWGGCDFLTCLYATNKKRADLTSSQHVFL